MDNSKKSKFNIVDTFVVLILLALIFGIVFFFIRESRTIYEGRSEKNITYKICISGVESEYASTFVTGEKIYNSSTLNYIGTITKVETLPATESGEKAVAGAAEGEYLLKQEERHGLCDIYITLTAKTKLDTRGVAYIDSERITIDSELDVRCDNFAAPSRITMFSVG